MRTFYLFEVKDNIIKNYRNNYEELYSMLENIHHLKTEDIVLGYSIFNSIVMPLKKDDYNQYIKQNNLDNEKFLSNDKLEIDIVKLSINNDGYDFRPRITHTDADINKITIFNHSMIDIILSKKIDKNFKRLAAITYDVINSDDDNTSTDATIALDEIAKLRSIILNKYQKFLEKEKEKKYIKSLRILENELRAKIVYINTLNSIEENFEVEEKKGRGR